MPGMAVRCSDRTTSTNRPLRSVITRSCRYLAVSRSRRNDFEIPAQPVALLVEAAANRLQLRARIVVDVAGGVDLPVNVLALPFPGGAAVHDRRQRRIRPAPGIANRLTRPFDRLEKAGQLPQIERGEGLRLDGEPRQDSREVAGRFEGDALVVGGEKPDRFGSVGERGLDCAPVGERPQLREPAGSQGCQGMAGDHLDHAVELEGPLGSCVHRCNGAGSQRTLARLGLPSDPGRDARKVRSGSLKRERISRRRRRAQADTPWRKPRLRAPLSVQRGVPPRAAARPCGRV